MSSILRGTRAISLAVLASLAALPMLSQAASACDQAKQSAWFEQQRQLTDGNASPFTSARALATQCKGDDKVAVNEPRDSKEEKAKDKSTSRE